MGHLCQRVGLIHKLAQRVSSEERIYNARNSLCIDKVCRLEHLIVAHIHTLTNGAAHTCQSDRELVAQLLTYSAHTTVRQVVNIIHIGIRVNQLNEIFDNLDDIILGQDSHIHVGIQTKFLVDTIATNLAQVVALVREEEVLEHFTGAGIIGRVSITQLTIDV